MAFAALKLRLFMAATMFPTLSSTSGVTALPVTLSPSKLQAVVTMANCLRSAALDVAMEVSLAFLKSHALTLENGDNLMQRKDGLTA